jgi:hypothetical protein
MGQPCVDGACACAAQSQQANPVQLDLFIMLDQSASMTDMVQGGGTKWDAVTKALKAFFVDPANAAIGAGIQYFGLPVGNLPSSCNTDADCGAYGPCLLNICFGAIGGGDSCDVADYSKPEIEIAPLTAAHAMQLSTSVNGHMPTTSTPTGPALQGAVNHAHDWAAAHAGHVVVVIFVTDGDPSECSPMDIPSISGIAAQGLAGAPSVKTFVIGVGSSLANLNSIAASGGTSSAFLVDTNANVVQQFEMALKALQKNAVGCQYTIPAPMMGQVDYGKVNVQYTPSNGPAQPIPNVANAAACNANTGGWYYDNNNAPTKILLCPASCTKVQADAGAKVDVLLGCATMHM